MSVSADTSVVSAALAALTTVRDPELDKPITALGFVASCVVSCEGRAVVRLLKYIKIKKHRKNIKKKIKIRKQAMLLYY
jgi:metal-sulfur cluster biosynthetic enzyme